MCPFIYDSFSPTRLRGVERERAGRMRITTVLLDAGGVLLNESTQEAVRAAITVDILRSIVSEYSSNQYVSDIEEAVTSFCSSVYQYVFWKYSKHDRSLFDALWSSYIDEWQRRKPPLQLSVGLEPELRAIHRDFTIGIAGQYGQELLALLTERSLLDCFPYRLTQENFTLTKPDPRYYEQLVRACGVKAQECIMVGDRIDKDVIPAKQVGMRTILVRVGLHRHQQPRIPFEIPDRELSNVAGLAEAVVDVARSV